MNFFRFAPAFLLLFVSAISAPTAYGKRFIVIGADSGKVHSRAMQLRGKHLHRMKNYNASVMEMSDAAASQIKKEFGSSFTVEEDFKVEALGKAHGNAWWNDVFGNGRRNRAPSQPAQTKPWGIKAVHAPEAWAITKGAGIKVCVVDTGVQKNHPDLQANIAGGKNFVSINGVVDKTRWDDDNGHGTHVSGTIAAIDNTIGVVGVAPQAKIYAVKVLDRNGSGFLSAVADGIRECVTAGAKIISMSLGSSGDSTLVKDAVKFAADSGLIIVAAAGNDGGPVLYPAKYPQVWAISAVDSNLKFASFSNFGPEVDFAAPGVSVYSTVKSSGYAYYSGTSMATPHVAGIAALALAAGRNRIAARDIGLVLDKQGNGFADAFLTVKP